MFISLLHHATFYFRASLFCLVCAALFSVWVLLFTVFFTFHRLSGVTVSDKKINMASEMIWSMIPLLMLIIMMIPILNVFIHQWA